MAESPFQRALAASAVSLVVAVACIAMFIPPLVENTVSSPLRATFFGISLAAAILLHWVFLAVAARRIGRSAGGWVGLSVVLFPVGSIAALILLGWFQQEADGPASPPSPA